jgi:Tol biopolymer transport system component
MRLGHTLRMGVAVIAAAVGVFAATGAAGAGFATSGKIAYTSMWDGQADIYSLDTGAIVPTQFNLTHDKTLGLRVDVEPAWSPDGTMVAFERQYAKRGGADLMVVNANGKNVRTLVPPTPQAGTWNCHPTWSPDGNMVAFTSNRDGNLDLYMVKGSGLGLKQLTFTKDAISNVEPQWSPDGRSIVFVRSVRSATAGTQARIYVLRLDTGKVVQLSRPATDRGVGDSSPSWSPNGTRIAFTSDRMGSNDIYVMNANGSDVMQVTQKMTNEVHPTWSSDGKTLAFISNRSGATEIFTIGAPSSQLNPGAQPLKQLTFDKAYKANPTWERVPTTAPHDTLAN